MAPDPTVAAVIALLAETFPRCFTVYEGRRRPLKLGIHRDILAAFAEALTPAELNAALRAYCGNRVYLERSHEGAPAHRSRRQSFWRCFCRRRAVRQGEAQAPQAAPDNARAGSARKRLSARRLEDRFTGTQANFAVGQGGMIYRRRWDGTTWGNEMGKDADIKWLLWAILVAIVLSSPHMAPIDLGDFFIVALVGVGICVLGGVILGFCWLIDEVSLAWASWRKPTQDNLAGRLFALSIGLFGQLYFGYGRAQGWKLNENHAAPGIPRIRPRHRGVGAGRRGSLRHDRGRIALLPLISS